MLEDDFNDCLKKALLGHEETTSQVAATINVSETRLHACLNGFEDLEAIPALAAHLGLDTRKLLSLKEYQPDAPNIPHLTRCVSPFGHLGVNAFIVQHKEGCLIFDTGTDSSELKHLAPSPTQLWITHRHPDHMAEAHTFHCPTLYAEDIQHGETVSFDPLHIQALDVSGHFTPAKAYFITGLKRPICILGDCLFAGSIGKCPSRQTYDTALSNIRKHIFTLPKDTILCPGHGPLTTVAQEMRHNPFF